MKRIVELDAIRGLAALLIVFYHMRPELSFGWTRVELFLVLSGFLVTTITLKSVGSLRALPTFYARRILRIWPCYFLALAAVVALNPYLNEPFGLDGLPYYLTFTQNLPYYWGAEPPSFSSYFFHTWTLANIEQFYVLWPLGLCLVGPRRLLPIGLGLIGASVALRASGLNPWVLLARCDGLVMGGMLALAMADPERVKRHLARYRQVFAGLIAAAYLVLSWSLADDQGRHYHDAMSLRPSLTVFGSALLYTGLIGLVVTVAGSPRLGWLRRPRVAALGTISYGLYLYHPIVLVAVGRGCRTVGIDQSPWMELLQLTACMLVAFGSYRLIERPMLALKSRLPYGATPTQPDRPQPSPAAESVAHASTTS